MMLKLKYFLGIGNLTLLERRRGCTNIPSLWFCEFLISSSSSSCHVSLPTNEIFPSP
jgi:hypothetical protein